ncbi:UNVERIFIED_CONTAM: hypothetical protein Sradi_0669500 [Sesamum radiatum]|uniref:Uncharacterized protein n=1 Tax=Sesamum radiatum TaxID=300843 RepID=A0AAW2VM01_SESRA
MCKETVFSRSSIGTGPRRRLSSGVTTPSSIEVPGKVPSPFPALRSGESINYLKTFVKD